jgi:cold shock protein
MLCDRGGMDFLRIGTVIAGSGWIGAATGRGAPSALQRPHFSCLLCHNSDFGRSGRCVPTGRIRIGSLQNPGCGAVSSDAVALRTFETSLTRRQTMQKGTVKWFNPTKGYGFIRPSTGEKDVFVHISAVERAGLSTLNEGQTVEYELVTNRGKTSAENLKVS